MFDGREPIYVQIAESIRAEILSGALKEGDQVIVDGFQKMMVPGAPVKAVPWTGAAPAAAGAPAAPASAPAAAASAAGK